MVKPDIKHNYYADLELPTSASIEDIRKAYRKLALQYHPDRNSGREDEVVPKFQAIQAASEVLGDPIAKEKYDMDRRKAGFFNAFTSRTGTPSNPYAATSAYPPPPRRAQNPAWQRPQSGHAPPPSGPSANGADRFSNFPRPTSKKDPAQDRTNAFRAWQNMNNAGKPRPTSWAQPSPQPSPQANKMRSQQPPPRMPQDDPARSGAKYKVPPPYDAEGADKRSSAWASFRQGNAGRQGMPPGNTFKTPNRQGFNPNAPGSDERPAPGADRHHAAPHAPTSPTSPRARRPDPNPQRPFGRTIPDDQVPFAEGTRERTPYTRSFYGEQPDFLREGLRRSHSFRDSPKQPAEDESPQARARSSSPRRGKPEQPHPRDIFDAPSSSSNDMPNDRDARQTGHDGANGDPTSTRPKKVPTGPSRFFAKGSTYGAQSDTEQPRGNPNMYADPSTSSSPSVKTRLSGSTPGAARSATNSKIPAWAIPSSVNPSLPIKKATSRRSLPKKEEFVTGADQVYINASEEERVAFMAFQKELAGDYQNVPGNLDMEVFLILLAMWRRQESTGDALLDRILQRVLERFSYSHNPDLYATAQAKSRSEENINTTFSTDGWTGTFTGEPDYFPETSKQSSPPRRPTPNRNASSQQRSSTPDVPTPGGTSTSYEQVPQRPWGSDGTPSAIPRTPAPSAGFDGEQWRRDLEHSKWSWPPPPPNPPSPSKGGRKHSQARKGSKMNAKNASSVNTQQPAPEQTDSHNNDVEDKHDTPVNDGDAMDIDDGPPAQQSASQPDQGDGARVYSVPPSEWRQQHEHNQRSHRKSSTASKKANRAAANHSATKFNTNLDDLREAVSQRSTKGGALNFADMESALPFESQASEALAGNTLFPRDLKIPAVPKAPLEPQRLSKASWHVYTASFGEYVKAFHQYNTTMLQHFQGREQQVQDQMSDGMGWLEATGDTSGMLTAPTGFGQYLRGIKEDRAVREAWTVAWDRHRDAVLVFDKVRDRVRKLAVGGMLVEN